MGAFMLAGGNCVDCANYQWPLTPELCAAWYASGVRYAIVGCQNPDIARLQIPMLRAAGIEVISTYAYLYFGYQVDHEIQNAIDVAIEFSIPLVALDCENGGELPGVSADIRISQIREGVGMVEVTLTPWIYTGDPFWTSSVNNTTEFSHLALWHAAYWYDLHKVEDVNYGGWTKAAVHQYTATGNQMYDENDNLIPVPSLNGMSVDYDYLFYVPGGEMADPRVDQLVKDVADIKALMAENGYMVNGVPKTGEEAWSAAVADGSSLDRKSTRLNSS